MASLDQAAGAVVEPNPAAEIEVKTTTEAPKTEPVTEAPPAAATTVAAAAAEGVEEEKEGTEVPVEMTSE